MLLIIEPNGRTAELVEGIAMRYWLLRGIAKEDGCCDCIGHFIKRFVAVVVVH